MRNVAFVLPNSLGAYGSANLVVEHLGIALLSSVLTQNNILNKIIDARMYNLSPEQASENIDIYDMIGLTIPLGESEAVPWTIEFVERCKKINPKVHLIAGGYLPTILPEIVFEYIPDIELIVLGEGEETIIEIITAYKNGTSIESIPGIVYRKKNSIIKNQPRSLIMNLNSNPLPYRYAKDFANEEFEAHIEGARGCMNNCIFCVIKPFFCNNKTQWRARSAESLIREVKYIEKAYPASKRIRFVDPDFIGDPDQKKERILEFCKLLKSNRLLKYSFFFESRVHNITNKTIDMLRLMKETGFVEVYLGLESGSDSILKIMNKQATVQDSINAINILKEVGIDIAYGFMMFTPWTNMDDVKKNIEFLAKIGDVQFDRLFHKLYLIPKTPSTKMAERKKLLRGMNADGYYDYDFEHNDVAVLASVRDYLRKHHLDFLVEIWYAYKDAKTWGQAFPNKARNLLEGLSLLSLDIFADLCKVIDYIDMNIENKNSYIDSIIKQRYPEIKLLHQKTNYNYRFPRPKSN
ncbi:MAG: radical SAM protein [Clostridiales bacterium]